MYSFIIIPRKISFHLLFLDKKMHQAVIRLVHFSKNIYFLRACS